MKHKSIKIKRDKTFPGRYSWQCPVCKNWHQAWEFECPVCRWEREKKERLLP